MNKRAQFEHQALYATDQTYTYEYDNFIGVAYSHDYMFASFLEDGYVRLQWEIIF